MINPSNISFHILGLAFAVGVVQSITPDRWLPGSIVSWKRGYNESRTIGLSMMLGLAHILMGFGLYKVLQFFGLRELVAQTGFGLFAALVLFTGLTLRYFSFNRIKEIVLSSSRGTLPMGLLIQLIGPSEVLVLVLVRTQNIAGGLLPVFFAYSAGTLLAISLLSLFGRELWNNPFWLPRGLQIATQSTGALSIATGIGLTLLSAARFL